VTCPAAYAAGHVLRFVSLSPTTSRESKPMLKRWTPPLAIALISLALVAIPSSAFASTRAAQTADTSDKFGVAIQLLDVATELKDDPRAQSAIVDNIAPGESIERNFRVRNSSTTAQTVVIYTTSASVTDGSFTAGKNAPADALASWAVPAQTEIALEADASADIALTIAIPSDAPEGEQYAALWAEVKSAPDAESNIITANRAGIRMYVSVGAGNGPAAAFSIDSITAARDDAGAPQINAAVTNTGGRAVDIRGTVSLANGPGSLSAGPFELTETTTLAPGESGEVSVTLDDALPNGPWDATLTLTSGLLSEEASATITFPDAGTGDTVVVEDNEPNWLILGGGIVVFLVAFGAFARLWIIRRRTATQP